jgi:alkylhydroperoxidase family enzyme
VTSTAGRIDVARVSLLPFDEIDAGLRARADRWIELGGDPNMLRAFAHMPDHFSRFLDFYGPLVNRGRVPLRVKEMARLRVASLNECRY